MINKNFYRKTNDKKILHKVGKQWKVISVALLMAIGGAAVATHVNANAASTNDQNNAQTNSLADYLNTSATANPPRFAAKPTSAKSSVAPSSVSAGIHYYAGSNGSAASYFDKVDADHGVAAKYYNTVNSYVQSLNAEYNPQVSSFATKSASAKSAASNDSKLAKSYSATANNGNTVNVINSLANANHMDPTIYQGMVQDNEIAYSGAVKSASNDVNANSDVDSLVNSVEGINFSAASLSASTASVVAASNFNAANAVSSSVDAYYGYYGSGAGEYLNIANKLSGDVQELLAQGNPINTNTNLSMLLNDNGMNDAEKASANSAFNSAVSFNVNSAKNSFANIASHAVNDNYGALSDYANNYGLNDNLVSDYASVSNDAVDANNYYESSEYEAAVSAATAAQFAPVLASAANSLYGRYNPQFANYQTRSAEAKSAEESASAAVKSAAYTSGVTSANYEIIKSASNDIADNNSSTPEAIYNLINNDLDYGHEYGLMDALDVKLDVAVNSEVSNNSTNINSTIENSGAYASAINNSLNGSAKSLFDADSASVGIANGNSINNVISRINGYANHLSANANALNNASYNNDNDAAIVNNRTYYDTTIQHVGNYNFTDLKAALSHTNDSVVNNVLNSVFNTLPSGVVSTHANQDVQSLVNKLNSYVGQLRNIANVAGQVSNGLNVTTTTSYSNSLVSLSTSDASYRKAALLSDGIDLDKLNAESDAINNVTSAAINADNNIKDGSYAEGLGDGLSTAASSAVSAKNSAETVSANYSSANDEGITLASYFASSYTNDANSEADVESAQSSSLNDFFKDAADNDTFTVADDAYSNAEEAATNDYKLGVSNAKAVYNSLPHFLDVLKGARIHTTPNFGSKGDKVTGAVNKGDRLTVKGVNVSRNNSWRGVTRYYVYDNSNKKSGFITAQPEFTKGAYLSAIAEHADVEVKTLKPVQIYDQINGKKAIATLPAGKVIENADVVYDNADEDAQGFTKVETPSDDSFTANTDYVEIVTPTVNNNNNTQSNYAFNLQNPNQKMGPYYNDASQD